MPNQQPTASSKKKPEAMKRKVLVVDDEPTFTRLLKLNLEATGRYDIRAENDPQLALPAALEFRPDLMLIDVMMPEMDGGDVANLLAAHPELRHVPVLFLTATVQHSEVAEQNGNIGGCQFLAKPLDMEELLARLETHFEA